MTEVFQVESDNNQLNENDAYCVLTPDGYELSSFNNYKELIEDINRTALETTPSFRTFIYHEVLPFPVIEKNKDKLLANHVINDLEYSGFQKQRKRIFQNEDGLKWASYYKHPSILFFEYDNSQMSDPFGREGLIWLANESKRKFKELFTIPDLKTIAETAMKYSKSIDKNQIGCEIYVYQCLCNNCLNHNYFVEPVETS
jgi:hypothetical protein